YSAKGQPSDENRQRLQAEHSEQDQPAQVLQAQQPLFDRNPYCEAYCQATISSVKRREIVTPDKARLFKRKQAKGRTYHQAVNNFRSQRRTTTLHEAPTVLKQWVLPIATALIFNEDEMDYQPVNLLLDSGAQRSFIKSQLSDDLKLSALRTASFTTSGIGEVQEIFSSNEVPITLKGLKCSTKLKRLPVHTKEMLITSLETAQLSQEDLKFISTRDINIAQKTLSKRSVPLDILIGQDHLSNIIDRTNPVLQMPSGLILTPTVFGYTISGTSTFTSNTATTRVDEAIPVAATTTMLSKNNYKREVKRLKPESFPGLSRTILGIASQRNSNTAISKTENRRRKFRKTRKHRYIVERHARHTLFKDGKNTVNQLS
ncbi:Tas retrotransposon peptidase A16, partial [Oesophagostomum dentatum]